MIFGYLLSRVVDPQPLQMVSNPASAKNYHFPNPDSEAQKAKSTKKRSSPLWFTVLPVRQVFFFPSHEKKKENFGRCLNRFSQNESLIGTPPKAKSSNTNKGDPCGSGSATLHLIIRKISSKIFFCLKINISLLNIYFLYKLSNLLMPRLSLPQEQI